ATLAGDHPAVANTLGLVLLANGEPAAAIVKFEEAVEKDAAYAPAWLNLGALSLRYRDYGAAEAAFQKAAALEPGSIEAQRYLAWALSGQQSQDPEKALAAGAAYEQVIALAGEDPEAVCGAAWAYAAHRDGYERAQPLLTRCRDAEATPPVERARIDAKLQAIASVLATPEAQSADAQPTGADAAGGAEDGASPAATAIGGAGAPGAASDADAGSPPQVDAAPTGEGDGASTPPASGRTAQERGAEGRAGAPNGTAGSAEGEVETPGVGGAGAPEAGGEAGPPPASGRRAGGGPGPSPVRNLLNPKDAGRRPHVAESGVPCGGNAPSPRET